MTFWSSIASKLPMGRRRGANAQQTLVGCYRSTFASEEGRIVLADLAEFCGFYQAASQAPPNETLQFQEGKRAAFGRLFSCLHLTPEERDALADAARREAQATNSEGEF